MRQRLGRVLERGSEWLARRGAGTAGARLKRLSYTAGTEPVRIDDLVSPLRYDIVFRQEYLGFFRAHQTLFAEDFEAFVELSRSHRYFTWFAHVEVPAFRPQWRGNSEIIDEAFAQRVRKTTATFEELESRGYDPRRPVVLRTGRKINATTTGKRISTAIYPGDGCHRLAWLRDAGLVELAPEMYRLQIVGEFTPRDMTAAVLEWIRIDLPEYFSFLSLAYAPDLQIASEEGLVAHVRSAAPDRLDELRRVISADSPRLSPSYGD
jgi:hypothetical protein